MRTAFKATLGETAMIYASLSVCLRDSAAKPCTFGTQFNVFSRESSAFLLSRKHLWYLLWSYYSHLSANVNPFIIFSCVGRGLGPAERTSYYRCHCEAQRGRSNDRNLKDFRKGKRPAGNSGRPLLSFAVIFKLGHVSRRIKPHNIFCIIQGSIGGHFCTVRT